MQAKIQQYLARQENPNTKKAYKNILNKFLAWRGDAVLSPAENWGESYTQHLLAGGLSNRTINTHLVVLRKFWEWATETPIKIETLKIQPSEVKTLSMADIKKIMDYSDIKFRVVVAFLIDTGIRVGELSELSYRNFGDELPEQYTVRGKGGKQRTVYVSAETHAMLAKTKRGGLIFGKGWPVWGVQQNLRRIAQEAGVPGIVYPHQLRHTFATKVLANGADITDVQQMLGHSDIRTTQIYTHITPKRIQEKFNQFHAGLRKEK